MKFEAYLLGSTVCAGLFLFCFGLFLASTADHYEATGTAKYLFAMDIIGKGVMFFAGSSITLFLIMLLKAAWWLLWKAIEV